MAFLPNSPICMYCRNIYIVRLHLFGMDLIDKNHKEIENKQKKFGKLEPEQKEIYAIVKERIAGMNQKQRIKLLKKKTGVDKLIAEVREELRNG